MTKAETLAEYYGLTYRVIKRQLDGVSHEESLVQPPFRGNCLNWVLGHIVCSRAEVLIPTCVLRDASKMREVGHRPEAFRISFQLIESITYLVNDLIERGKSQIRQVFFAHFFPDMSTRTLAQDCRQAEQ
jgi:hypothetical protein